MADTNVDVDLTALRRKVRAGQHTRSVPLIVLGALLVNYGAVSFAPSPVPWRFGAPLAFVGVWVALTLNETRTGLGTARADYLVAGGFVFTATNIVQVRPFAQGLPDLMRLPGIWTIIVALAVFGVALAVSDWVLMVAAAAIGAAGLFIAATGGYPGDGIFFAGGVPEQPWGDVLVAIVGTLMVVGGILAYRFERSAS
jgi:hypothetical protein